MRDGGRERRVLGPHERDRFRPDGQVDVAIGQAAVGKGQRGSTDLHVAVRCVSARQPAANTVGVAHESGDESVARLFVEFARGAFLRDTPLVHHDDAVGHGHRLRLVMRDVHDRERQPLLQLPDFFAHLATQPRVEIGQRFVEEQHAGLEHQRAGNGNALLLPARQLRGQPIVELR